MADVIEDMSKQDGLVKVFNVIKDHPQLVTEAQRWINGSLGLQPHVLSAVGRFLQSNAYLIIDGIELVKSLQSTVEINKDVILLMLGQELDEDYSTMEESISMMIQNRLSKFVVLLKGLPYTLNGNTKWETLY